MKIRTVLFKHFRNGEFLQFAKNFLNVILRFNLVDLSLSSKESALNENVKVLDEVFKPLSGKELTEELELLDVRRDKALIGMEKLLQSYLYREEEEQAEAASLLLNTYESFDERVDKLPYQQQTAVTNAYIKEVKSNEMLRSALKKTGITKWFNLLEEVNDIFDKTYVDRSVTNLPPAKIQEKRDAIKKCYADLAGDIEAFARVADNKEAYIPLIDDINGLIDDYNKAVLSRLRGRISSNDVAPQQQN